MILYDGTNVEQIRAALNALKPESTIVATPIEDGWRFDQIWHDGQRSDDRWRIREGQYLVAETGAVVDQPA